MAAGQQVDDQRRLVFSTQQLHSPLGEVFLPGAQDPRLTPLGGPTVLPLTVLGASSTRPLFRIRLTFPELASVLTYNLPSRTTNQMGVGTSFPLLRKVVKFMFLCPSNIGKGCVSPASVKIFSHRSREPYSPPVRRGLSLSLSSPDGAVGRCR